MTFNNVDYGVLHDGQTVQSSASLSQLDNNLRGFVIDLSQATYPASMKYVVSQLLVTFASDYASIAAAPGTFVMPSSYVVYGSVTGLNGDWNCMFDRKTSVPASQNYLVQM